MPALTPFGTWLKSQRQALDLSKEDLAQQIGCSHSLLEKLELGTRRPSRQIADLLATRFAVPSARREAFLRFARNAQPDETFLSALPSPSVSPTPATLRPPCPYRGLAAFQRADAPFFFGREAFAARLYATVVAHPLVAVVGTSGSGKSSVVYAGLWPRLDPAWHTLACQPGSHPHASLSATLAQIAPQTPTCLLIDQFEETFTLCTEPAECAAFLAALLALPTTHPACHAVLTVRADFWGHLIDHRPLADALQNTTLALSPMTQGELLAAITRPATHQGVTFDPGLVERILESARANTNSLPLIEFALTALWEQDPETSPDVLTHDDYAAIGGVTGALTRHAEAVFAELTPDEQVQARTICLQMVQPGEAVQDTRRRAVRTDFDPEIWSLAQWLASTRLVVTGRDDTGQETVELVHEALIHHWERLGTWLDTDRAFRAWQERLRFTLRQWDNTNHDEGALLYGAPLAEAEGWLDERPAAFSPAERAFVQASQALRQRRADERDAQQRRELEAAQRLAAVEHLRAEEHAQAALTAQRLAEERAAAQRAAEWSYTHANAQRLAGLANQLLLRDGDPTLIALLSLHALDLEYTLEGDSVLANAARLEYPVRVFSKARAACFSADGRALTILMADKQLVTWDLLSGAESCNTVLCTTVGDLHETPLSLDGRYVTTFSVQPEDRGVIRLYFWDTTTGEAVGDLLSRGYKFAPDSRAFLTVNPDHSLALWDLAAWHETRHFETGTLRVSFLPAFTIDGSVAPDNQRLIILGANYQPQVWDVQRAALLEILATPNPVALMLLRFSPDGSLFVTGTTDKKALLWDAQTGQIVRQFEAPVGGTVRGFAFSSDNRYLYASSDATTTLVWDTHTGAIARRLTTPHLGGVQAQFSLDDRYLAITDFNRNSRLFDVRSKPDLQAFSGHTNRITIIAFSPRDETLATASIDGTIRVWDPQTGQQILLMDAKSSCGASLVFSTDGRFLLSGHYDGAVRKWDAATGQLLQQYSAPGKTFALYSAAISLDNRYLLTGCLDQMAHLWDLTNGQEHCRFSGHTRLVYSVAFSPDGTHAFTGSWDQTARIWNVQTGECVGVFSGHSGTVSSVVVARAGQTLLTTSFDGTARLWDIATRTELQRFSADADLGIGTFSPDERYIAAPTATGAVVIWESATGKQVRHLSGHTSGASCVCYTPNGQQLVSAGDDTKILFWDADYHTTIEAMRTRLTRDFTPEERARFELRA